MTTIASNKLYLTDSTELEALRALCRYEMHGGYVWAGVMSDGELMCVPCLRAEYRQVFRATRAQDDTGFALVAYADSGSDDNEADSPICCNCNKEIWNNGGVQS